MRRRAFRSTRAWPGIGRCRRTSCAGRRKSALPARRLRAPRRRPVHPDSARRDATRHRQARRGRLLQRAGRRRRGDDLKAAGGVQTEEDFANGRDAGEFVEPISLRWRGLDVWQCPPNGPGLVALMMLGELEALGDAPAGPAGVTRFHRHIEAARMAYRDRGAFLADPRQRETPLARLLAPDYLAALALRHIDDKRALPLARPRRDRAPARWRHGHAVESWTSATAPLPASSTRSMTASAAALSAKAPASSCKTGDCAFPSRPAIRTLSRPTLAPRTPSCPAWRRGRSALDVLRRDGRVLSTDGCRPGF